MKSLLIVYVFVVFTVSHQEATTFQGGCNTETIDVPNAVFKSCFSIDGLVVKQTANIQCKPGYYLNAIPTITCSRYRGRHHHGRNHSSRHYHGRVGLWDVGDARCITGCPPPGTRSNSRLNGIKEHYKIGGKISYTCDAGYFSWTDYRMNYFNLTCERDSTWSDKGVGYCYQEREFSVSSNDLKIITTDAIELDCGLEAVETSWYQNGSRTNHNLTSTGNLIINLKTSTDLSGFYICTGKVRNRLEIGKKAYELIGNTICQSTVNTSREHYVEDYEGENILLTCPQDCNDYTIKWFKDGEEIITNAFQNVIPKTGLFLSNVTLNSEAKYTCQISNPKIITHYNISHDLTVVPSTENICGIKRVFRSKQTSYQPWLGVIRRQNPHFPICYATLLNSNWVITTASCALNFKLENKRAGSFVQFGPPWNYPSQILRDIYDVKIHPLYRRGGSENDVGLIRLGHSYEFSNYDNFPACISPDDIGNIHKCELSIADLSGTVAGFKSWWSAGNGKSNGAVVADVERMILVAKKVCQESKPFHFGDDQFCAKFGGIKENFVGDVGSPFLVYYKGRRYLLGIYSSGDRDTGDGNYDYFTSVSYHYKWIKENID